MICFPTMHLYDRWGTRLGVVRPLGAVEHVQGLDGKDELRFDTLGEVSKGNRLLWRDGDEWREHVVERTSRGLDGVVSVLARGSMCELEGCYIESAYVSDKGPADAFGIALAGTGWGVEVQGSASSTVRCWLYHTSVADAVSGLADSLGVEVSARVSVGPSGVTARTLVVTERRGGWHGARFDYGRNLAGCERTVMEDGVCTALYGYGAGLKVLDEEGEWHGGYSRKLTFGDVNGGVNWVGDEDAREVWGLPGSTGKRHVFGEVVFSRCEDPAELLALTQAELTRRCVPKVTYVVDAVRVDGCPELGDDVLVVDPLFANGRVIERCVRRERTFGECLSVRLTLGYVEKTITDTVADLDCRMATAERNLEDVAGEVSVVSNEVFGAEPVPAGLLPRALLLEDGTLELTCLDSEESPSGGTVRRVFAIAQGCTALSQVPWRDCVKSILAVAVHPSMAAAGITDIAYWFYGCTNLASVSGMRYLSGLTGMAYLFTSCTSLTSLDLRGFTLDSGANLKATFANCNGLTTITVDDTWQLPTLSSGFGTFQGCTSLMGGNGTTYASNRISGAHMVVDHEGVKGYLTTG